MSAWTPLWGRRELLKAAWVGPSAASAALGAHAAASQEADEDAAAGQPEKGALEAYRAGFAAPPLERVRIGFVGVGLQGGGHVRNFLRIEGVDLVAVCDIDE
ncbi:MAG: hypothetical protein F4Y16_15775, partial [Holophagales bacterium]|nr:hypothetical protein [Holophagales bacterium]